MSSVCFKMPPIDLGLESIPAETAVAFAYVDGTIGFGHAQDKLFPAASVIKLAILGAFYQEVEAGRCDPLQRVVVDPDQVVGGAGVLFEFVSGLSPTWLDLARLMIVVSDNTASNMLLRRLGMDRVNRFLAESDCQGRFGRFFMEPASAERDNSMSASDAVKMLRFFTEESRLKSELQREALDVLGRQQYREKIPLKLPADLTVAHKTGELEGVRHDAALVEHPRRPYFLAILTRNGGEPWLVDAGIADLSRKIYDWVEGL